MSEVAVIGAGIAGLSAAFELRRKGVEVSVFEASQRVGGVIATERAEGFLVEHGPNSVRWQGAALDGIVRALGLDTRKVEADPTARNRYIVRDGHPVPAPSSPMKLATSGLFGSGAKLRLLREPFVPPSRPDHEESVAQFSRRRLGDEILEYGINPFVGGVYAGDPERLSMRYAFPSIYELEQASGSIVRGRIEKRRGAASAAETHRMYSFEDGLGELPRAIARALGDIVHTSAPVQSISLNGSDWLVNGRAFRSVIYAAPLHRLSDLRLSSHTGSGPAEADVALLAKVIYPPLSVIALGYRRDDIRHPLNGFGMLVPEAERSFRLLGTLFTSSIFPGRAPDGHVLLTSFVGGMRNPQLATRPSNSLYEIVEGDLDRLLGVTGSPVFRRHVFWPKSIPQYNVGYGDVQTAIQRLETSLRGLFLAGNYREGISVGHTVRSGSHAAQESLSYLAAN